MLATGDAESFVKRSMRGVAPLMRCSRSAAGPGSRGGPADRHEPRHRNQSSSSDTSMSSPRMPRLSRRGSIGASSSSAIRAAAIATSGFATVPPESARRSQPATTRAGMPLSITGPTPKSSLPHPKRSSAVDLVFYTPKVVNSPGQIEQDIARLRAKLAHLSRRICCTNEMCSSEMLTRREEQEHEFLRPRDWRLRVRRFFRGRSRRLKKWPIEHRATAKGQRPNNTDRHRRGRPLEDGGPRAGARHLRSWRNRRRAHRHARVGEASGTLPAALLAIGFVHEFRPLSQAEFSSCLKSGGAHRKFIARRNSR